MSHRFRIGTLLAFATLAVLLGAARVQAQSDSYFDRNNNVGVLDRPRPDYQELGILADSLEFYPSVTVVPEYNDNIFATTKDPIGDLITELSTTVDVKSNWSRNEIDLKATDTSSFYDRHSAQNTSDYQVSASGRLDILTQSDLTAGLSAGHFAIPRSAGNTFADTTTPIQYDRVIANLGGLQTLNRLQFLEGFDFAKTAYQDDTQTNGVPLFLNQFNNNVFDLRAQVAYGITPAVAVFVAAAGNDRLYDLSPSVSLFSRDSSGYETTVGTNFDITRLIRGQVEVGYLAQYYASPLYHTVSGFAFHARVDYFPSGLTTLTLHLDRQVVDAIDFVAVSFLQSQVGLEVDHELLRNVIVAARGGYEVDTYTGEPRNDQRTTASARATYLINRHLGVTGAYSFVNEYSSGAARIPSYRDNVVSISLVLQE